MNRQLLITAIAFVIAAVLAVVLLQYGFHVRGGVLKVFAGVTIGAVVAAATFMVTRTKVPAK
jgi:hypothetical protein